MISAGPLDARAAMTAGQPSEPERVHDAAGSGAEQGGTGQLGDGTVSGARLVGRPRIVLGNPEAARPVPVGAHVSQDALVLLAPLRHGLERGPVRLADDHLPRIGDDVRRPVRSVKHEGRVTEHQMLDDAVGHAQDGYRGRRTDRMAGVAGVPVIVGHLLNGLGEHCRKAAARC